MLTAAVELIQKTATRRFVESTGRVVAEQLGESENRIERGPQLMDYAGEELTLHPICSLSLFLGVMQCFLRLFGLGDVFGDSKQERRLAGCVQDRNLLRLQYSWALLVGLYRPFRNIDQVSISDPLPIPCTTPPVLLRSANA